MNILIIEDEKKVLQGYIDTIEAYNTDNNLRITTHDCSSYDEGIEALKTPNFDAAIIDLKLSNTDELEGKRLIEEVYKKIRIPIVVYSGSIAQIDDIPESILLKKKLRTETLVSILDEIREIYDTGITSFLRPNGIVDEKLTDIFWNNLSQDINIWIKHKNRNTLLRYILTHFQEHLDINTDGDFEEYHPMEVYLAPPIKKNLHTGDLIEIEGEFFIVLTPACDIVINYKVNKEKEKIAFRKADGVVLAKVIPFDYQAICKTEKGELDKGKVKEYVTNGNYRYHYLPPFKKNEAGFLIDFQNLSTIKFDIKISRISTISSPFIKDIISRFSSYYSRQGQPTFMQGKIIEKLLENAKKK